MNPATFAQQFLTSTALRLPFPAVVEAGATGSDFNQETQVLASIDKTQKIGYLFGIGFAAVAGALVAMYGFNNRKRRK